MPFTQELAEFNCIVVLGVTASGKTNLACQLAYKLDGAIISADSRQVYKHLNIGTGKDLDAYLINGKQIPYYGIDIAEPNQQFYLHEFCDLLLKSFDEILQQKKLPIICGGTGLYTDALVKPFEYTQIKENACLRALLKNKSKEELIEILETHPIERIKQVDKSSTKRIIRGIEIAEYLKFNQITKPQLPYKPFYLGIEVDVDESVELILRRLKERMNNGMIEEVEHLLKIGITHERLINLGLEYKFISYYLQGQINYSELNIQLSKAIIQYSKRQKTWFKKIEKEGRLIHWFKKAELTQELVEEIAVSIKKAKSI